MKIASDVIVVLGEDGKFVNLPVADRLPHLCETITFEPPVAPRRRQPMQRSRWFAAALAAVVVFAIVGALPLLQTPQVAAAALVAVDINPSFELSIDAQANVLSYRPLNSDAERLAGTSIVGQPLSAALDALLGDAEKQGFLQKGKRAVMMTFVSATTASWSFDASQVAHRHHVDIEVTEATPETQKQAAAARLSINKYIVWQKAKERGIALNVDRLRSEPIAAVLADQGIDLPQLFHPGAAPEGNTPNTSYPPGVNGDGANGAGESPNVIDPANREGRSKPGDPSGKPTVAPNDPAERGTSGDKPFKQPSGDASNGKAKPGSPAAAVPSAPAYPEGDKRPSGSGEQEKPNGTLDESPTGVPTNDAAPAGETKDNSPATSGKESPSGSDDADKTDDSSTNNGDTSSDAPTETPTNEKSPSSDTPSGETPSYDSPSDSGSTSPDSGASTPGDDASPKKQSSW